jgi:hypothetical protein
VCVRTNPYVVQPVSRVGTHRRRVWHGIPGLPKLALEGGGALSCEGAIPPSTKHTPSRPPHIDRQCASKEGSRT